VVLGSTALALVWWLGLMHALGLALSQSSGNVAFVLLALAFSAYGGSFATRAAPDVPATRPFPGRTAAALVAIAFASVSLAKVKTLYIAHFGAVLAPGVLAILGSGALVFVPLASLLPPVAERKGTQRAYAPAVGVVLALLVLAIGGVVAKRGRFLITPQEMFSPQEQVGETLAFFDNRFGGTDFIQIDFKGDLRDPSVAARLLRLTDLLDGSRAFSDVRSVAQILGFLSHGFGGDFRIPSSRDSLANIWFFLEGNPDVKNLVSDKRDEAMVMVRIPSRPSSTMEVLESKVQAAIDGSARTDPAAAVERLAGLARSFSLEFPRDRIDAVVNAAARPLDAGDALQVNGRVSAHLREYLASPDSPYKPSDEEWGQFAAALARESDARQHVVEVAHSIGALTAKNIADAFVDTVLERDKALRLSARAEVLAERLWQGQANVPDSFKVRAQGAIADLLDPPANGGPAATITVSGFPVVAGAIETDLKRGLGLAVGLVLALGALVLLALTMNPSAVARTLLVAMSAAALTLIGCRLAGVLVDSGSATLYLGPAFVGLLSGGRTAGQHRSAVIFLLALAAGGVTLVFSGTMPVARVGAALTISVASVGLTSHLSRWFRNGVAT
jgi:predicted RND superfamily exporter protein